jgi:hypothetical protein
MTRSSAFTLSATYGALNHFSRMSPVPSDNSAVTSVRPRRLRSSTISPTVPSTVTSSPTRTSPSGVTRERST